MPQNKNSRITRKEIGGTIYIVESMVSENAKETVYTKIKRLILNNADEHIKQEKLSKVS